MMVRDSEVTILGAGIGGLTLAARLQQEGISFRIYEQAEELGEVGAGIGLWSNATASLARIGIGESFWADHGCEVLCTEIASASGRTLSRCDLRPVLAELETGCYVVHRADLHRAIAEKVSPDCISLGKELVGMDVGKDSTDLRFADGTEVTCQVLVGADGLRSQVRAALFGDEAPIYSGQTCYRGLARCHIEERQLLREIHGHGPRASVIPLDDDRVYWWATENVSSGGKRNPEEEKSHLLELFKDWSFGVAEAIEATPADGILRNDLYDRPPLETWSHGRVTLLGDAAHPTTPNLGQGACMAIEDADCLATLLSQNAPLSEVFSRYEKLRKKHCEFIVRTSRRFGWLGGWSHPAAVWLRERMMSVAPSSVMRRAIKNSITPARWS